MPVLPVTDPFWTAVTASHRVRTRVEVWAAGTYQTTLYPTDGTVTADATRAIRRNIDLTVVDSDGTLTPTSRESLLAPFNGNEIRAWRGITYPDGTYTDVPLGVFRITDVQISRNEQGITLAISGEDRAWWMSRLVYTDPFIIAKGTNIATAIQTVVEDRLGGAVTQQLGATSWTTAKTQPGVDGWTDPWQFCRELANTAGMEVFFDAEGRMVLADISDLDGDFIATFAENSNGTMLDVSRSMSIDSTPNGVKVVCASSIIKVPWNSVRWDDDESSPTYRDPSLPTTPSLPTDALQEFTTPLIPPNDDGSANTEQSDGMARALLHTVIGQRVSLSAVPNPALDVRDRIQIVSSRLGVNTVAMVDSVTIPLAADGVMAVTARARRLA